MFIFSLSKHRQQLRIKNAFGRCAKPRTLLRFSVEKDSFNPIFIGLAGERGLLCVVTEQGRS